MKQSLPKKKTRGSKYPMDGDLLNGILDELETQHSLIRELKEKLKVSDESLTRITARYNGLHLLSRTPILSLDRTGRINEYNEDAAAFLGEAEGLQGRPFVSLVSGQSIAAFRRELIRCITSREPAIFDVILNLQGRDVPVRLSILTRCKPGELVFLVTINDRSEMTRTARILEETLWKWDSLVHSAPDTIMILDSTGGITFANRAWLGRATTALVGNELFGFLPVAQQPRVRQCVVRATREGTTESCDIQLYNRKSKPWFNLRFAPVHSNGSQTAIPHQTVCLLIRDITHEKRAEIELQRTTQMLRGFSARTDEIREKERAHIAREIHDELGQTLTALKMDLSWLKSHWSTPSPEMEERTRDMDETLDSMVHTVRRISSELVPALLDLGLVPAIEWQLEQFQKRSGIRTQVRIQPTEVDLNKGTATAVFRVVQEALTNIARHAEANAVDFSMDLCEGELQLSILDNGRGITPEQIKSLSSFGLTGMRERIHHIGGILEIEQMTTGGTCVSVRLPIERLSDQSKERNKL